MTFTPLTHYPNAGTTRLVPQSGAYPSTIANGVTYDSDLLPAGFGGLAVGVLSDKALTLTVQRYADLAGLLPIGDAITQAVTANVAAWAGANDGLPYLSFNFTLANASGSLATFVSVVALTGPAGGF